MARTPSNMLPLGTTAPAFHLHDTLSNRNISLKEAKGQKGTVIMFICNHCPFVKHVNEGIVAMATDYQPKGINFIAISSNDVENYPADAPDKMAVHAANERYNFPYLYDEDQSVAHAYQAACTPDFYLFDADLKLVYRGQMDDSRPGNEKPVTGTDLRLAMDQLLQGKPINFQQKPSLGCNIKWKVQSV